MSDPPENPSPELGRDTLTYATRDPGDGDAGAAPGSGSDHDRRYQILAEHGRGGLGRVYRARDHRLERSIALKELLPGASRTAETRFVREALITARLEHPGIVPVYEAGRWANGKPFYAMKLVSGKPLKDLIVGAGSLHERLALLPHVIAVADAMAYAHDRGVVHRDLKPANVIVGEFGETVVVDWGLAKRVGDSHDGEPDAGEALADQLDVTRVGDVVGTPAYMAPEQAAGRPVTERADVYALGAILYQVLAGKPPFFEAGNSDVVALVRERAPAPVAEVDGHIPNELAAIVGRAMQRRPDDRYPNASAFADELRRFQRGQIVGAYRYSPRELAWRWVAGHRTALAAVVMVGLLVAAVAGLRRSAGSAAVSCDATGEEIDAVWNDAVAARLRDAFRATGVAFADEAWQQVDRLVDAYRSDWIDRRADACRATHVRRDQSEQMLDLRVECLDRRRAELTRLVDLLGDPDRGLVANAVDAVHGLTPASLCDDREALRIRRPLPADADRRARVTALQGELVDLKTRHAAGVFRGQLARAEEAVVRARDAGYGPVIAEAAYWTAQFRAAADDRPGAEAALRESILHADASHDDRARLAAYLALAGLDNGEALRSQEMRGYIEHARFLTERVTATPLDRARLLHAEAFYYERRSETLRALPHAIALVAVLESAVEPAHPDLIRARNLRGKILQSSGDRRQATGVYLAAERAAIDALGDRHPLVATIWVNLSYNARTLGDGERAEMYARKALALVEQAFGKERSEVAAAQIAVASALFQQERYDEAAEGYREAYELHVELYGLESVKTALAMSNLALAHLRAGRFEQALDWARRAIPAYEKSIGPEHRETIRAVGRVAAAELALGDYERACATYTDVIARMSESVPPHPTILDQIRGVAQCWLLRGDPRRAWTFLERGLEIARTAQEPPNYAALLELRAAQALWRGRIDRRRAVDLARAALRRMESVDGWDGTRDEIRAFLAAHDRGGDAGSRRASVD